jgi:uncharacterized protein (TIGR02117 family)
MRSLALAWGMCAWLAACAAPPPPPDPPGEPKTETIWLIERGWHTDIGIEAGKAERPLADIGSAFPGVRFLVFGFGERAYLLHRQHDSGDMLAALFPNPGAILVTALRDAPDAAFPPTDVVALPLSERQFRRLTAFIAASLTGGQDGGHRRIANGPYPGSAFYASTATYSFAFTCNTWTAEGLQTAGLPIRASGVLFAGDVMDQARRVVSAAR